MHYNILGVLHILRKAHEYPNSNFYSVIRKDVSIHSFQYPTQSIRHLHRNPADGHLGLPGLPSMKITEGFGSYFYGNSQTLKEVTINFV